MYQLAKSPEWSAFLSILIFFFGLILVTRISRRVRVTRGRAIAIYLWHSANCVGYFLFAQGGLDSGMYYFSALRGDLEISLATDGITIFGTEAIRLICLALINYLGASIVNAYQIFNIVGTIGLIYFQGCLIVATIKKPIFFKKLSTIVVFIPSISFWTASIGKDAIAFLSVTVALWAAIVKDKWRLMTIAVLLMFIARPYIAAMMLLAFTLSNLLSASPSKAKQLLLGLVLSFPAVILSRAVLKAYGFKEGLDLSMIYEFIAYREIVSFEGGSAIAISEMNTIEKILSYIFRPTILEATSVIQLLAAVDNFFILIFFILCIISALKNKIKKINLNNSIFIWFYSIGSLLMLSLVTANLGIAVRQKWMVLPMLMFLALNYAGPGFRWLARPLYNADAITNRR